MEVRSLSRLAFKSDLASHLFAQLGRDHQAESGTAEAAASRSFGLDKRLKQTVLYLERNPDPGIDDLEPQHHVAGRVVHTPCPNDYVAPFRELDRIRHKIVKNLAQPVRIALQSRRQIYVHVQGK